MFTIRDNTDLSRRDCVRAGGACFGGLALAEFGLPNLLRAEAAAGIRSSNKGVVFVHLDGGPPHMDMIDPKPDAPAEIRGEFGPISTKIPGLQIGELLPRLARSADKFAFIRSLIGSAGAHDAFQCQSGFAAKDLESIGGRPALGSVVARLRGKTSDQAPSFVDVMQGRAFVRNSARPGFLGPTYQPFRPDISRLFTRELEVGMKNELARRGSSHATSLAMNDGLTLGRLDDRTQLLSGLDRFSREADRSGMMGAVDSFTQQAVGILTSGKFAKALDLASEPAKGIARYSLPQPVERVGTSDDGSAVKKFLLARRLLEAGVRVVSLSLSDYDTHSGNFDRLRRLMPVLDCGLTAFVADLEERGMLPDVSIVVWGEFGRTPKINKSAGRDHWPGVGMALLVGGGMKTGQVIGSTDRLASIPTSRPVHYQDVIATLYHNLGINPTSTTLLDPSGRPQHVVDKGQVIGELV
ncbi:MAG: DUF1501 domain-containing protein [Planctomycetales bacterium]|nr:DUF1501 domain-containing protein [Planctomycetales bacterium]